MVVYPLDTLHLMGRERDVSLMVSAFSSRDVVISYPLKQTTLLYDHSQDLIFAGFESEMELWLLDGGGACLFGKSLLSKD